MATVGGASSDVRSWSFSLFVGKTGFFLGKGNKGIWKKNIGISPKIFENS